MMAKKSLSSKISIPSRERMALVFLALVGFYFVKGFSQVDKDFPKKTESQVESNNTPNNQIEAKPSSINFETSPEYRYEPVGKRDPFRPYRDAKVGVGTIRAPNRPLEPLEKFDVKALQVVAIVWSNEKPKALIQDPEKGLHSVIKGQRIGKNEGYIAEIREGEIVVVELFDLNGKVIKEPYILCIDKTKGCGT